MTMNDAEWFAEHTVYLATPEWAFKRGQVLNRDGYRCQARMDGCIDRATQAHHLSYKHWRNEPLFELVSVCSRCHEAITEMDRAQRPPDTRLSDGSATGQRVRNYLARSSATSADIALALELPQSVVREAIQRDPLIVLADGNDRYGLREVGFDIPGVDAGVTVSDLDV